MATADELLAKALTAPLVPIEWKDPDGIEPVAAADSKTGEPGVVTH